MLGGCHVKALIIEDDAVLSDSIMETIQDIFQCEQAYDGADGLFKASDGIYDVIILDIMLPEINGYAVLKKLRSGGIMTPVLILTAKDSIDDKTEGFKSGADDYLVKPFHSQELLLRLEAIVRRSGGSWFDGEHLVFMDLSIRIKSRQALIGDQPLHLTGKQYDLLEYLVKNQNAILTKEQIFDRIWGFDSETTTNVVEVYASGIRKELKAHGYDRYLRTVRGVGYMLSGSGDGNG